MPSQGSDPRWQGQGFPQIQHPFVYENGQITRPWLQLLLGLWTHSNGGQDTTLASLAFGNLEEGSASTSGSGGDPAGTAALQALLQADPQGTGGLGPVALAGTTSGAASMVMPFRDPWFKLVLVYCNAYYNSGGVAQTWTFPTPFQFAPWPLINIGPSDASVSATALTFPVSMAGAESGWIILGGF